MSSQESSRPLSSAGQPSPLVQVEGSRLTVAGSPLTLRGVGLGGSLNMENFITGYPGAEFQQRKALRSVLGEEGYHRFFDRFLEVFFSDRDAAFLESIGLNSVRIPFNYKHFEDDDNPFVLKEEGFARLDRVVNACAKHHLYAVLDLHALPGHQNQHWHSDNPTHWADFWTHRHFQDRVVNLWEALADRYRDNEWVAGYNPINEPADASGEKIGPYYRRLEKSIRAVDPDHVLFLDGNRYSQQFDQLGEPLPNVVYTAHGYATAGSIDGGPYPGHTGGQYVDKSYLEATFLERTSYMRQTGTPIWVGEFGPVYTGNSEVDSQRYRLLADQLEVYAKYDASWALWTYKDIGLQGLVTVSPDSEYMRRIASVVEKKRRLGVDSWGSVDDEIRHVMQPIEDLVATEFPHFDPYPWGQRRWVHGLVRHVLLAEAMVGDFAACFDGVTPDQAAALADAFQFENCEPREPLLAILAASASLARR